ncbi:hypothetical protein [Marinivivus vitaminiproducens]|uniref:hypothetical protein n=1 Tax=Marinivivus vitaminiproducens TaxID=3035935 RepID=UPI00279FECFA|nr:hypothetical protein P4R82_25100 [Geminicoccaceae bacterium SCSIO 64248]
MTLTSQIGWRLGVVIASVGVILAISLRIAGGGGGIAPMLVGWIITTGLVLGAVSFWPAIMQESFNTANEVSTLIGGSGVQMLDVLERGADQFSRTVRAAAAQMSLWPQSWIVAGQMVVLGVWIFLMHIATSLVLAAAILEFWLVGALLPLILPLALITGMQGVGLGALIWAAGMTIRLVLIAMVLAATTDLVAETIIPAPTEEPDITLYYIAVVAATVGTFLVWQTASWGRNVIQASAGASSITALASQAISGGARTMRGGNSDGRR